jgi:hypothetical protein
LCRSCCICRLAVKKCRSCTPTARDLERAVMAGCLHNRQASIMHELAVYYSVFGHWEESNTDDANVCHLPKAKDNCTLLSAMLLLCNFVSQELLLPTSPLNCVLSTAAVQESCSVKRCLNQVRV